MEAQDFLTINDISQHMTYYKLNESKLFCKKCNHIIQDPVLINNEYFCSRCQPIQQVSETLGGDKFDETNFLNRLEFRCKRCEAIYNYNTNLAEHKTCAKVDYKAKSNELKEKINILLNQHPKLREENQGRYKLTENQKFCEFHTHPLVLCLLNSDWECEVCNNKKKKVYKCYYCSFCDYHLCDICYKASTI